MEAPGSSMNSRTSRNIKTTPARHALVFASLVAAGCANSSPDFELQAPRYHTRQLALESYLADPIISDFVGAGEGYRDLADWRRYSNEGKSSTYRVNILFESVESSEVAVMVWDGVAKPVFSFKPRGRDRVVEAYSSANGELYIGIWLVSGKTGYTILISEQ